MKKGNTAYLGNCPVCGSSNKEEKASVVEKNGDAITLHVDCSKCQSSVLLTIYSGLKGLVTTVGVPTDLKKEDLPRIRRSKILTGDDVLELHSFLEKRKENGGKNRKTSTKS